MIDHTYPRTITSAFFISYLDIPRKYEDSPFLAPWKKNRTTNTCNPAIETIIKLSMTLKLKIRRSVLRTVWKLRFSRVRKYFWLREMVEKRCETLVSDSSTAVACSGLAPCREGSSVLASFSTCRCRKKRQLVLRFFSLATLYFFFL